MYLRALQGYEGALGPNHTSTLDTVNNLGNLYKNQGKLDESEQMYQRALAGFDKALGVDHTSTLNTVNNLGNLYRDQGKLDEAEQLFRRALAGYARQVRDKGCGASINPDYLVGGVSAPYYVRASHTERAQSTATPLGFAGWHYKPSALESANDDRR
ncbi:hypothetical protein LTR99_011135 [Exophiala xenobiotica]|uniref:Uncharacterized protein n=1 Tax=Vermiconidia calcicola TaxID=1690605 RepID=A0AAV9PQJ1_9PEZI|nr:hypothetical protein LTR92_011618 [Exophiala xenobiotica]KAK5527506.1 hypothetical protein LTR25_011119 [Vermiconidia calcicola]KAK5528506.1 hypothetical protein LTR23_011032 [Chaetothyriales sp. CCFEE 6169]KAK5290155.1 hypothetical protein LTR99_011135 [Exophiala xenobiotica]KAK5309976.1 hypothetical protein LTR93_012133 [Exophiala xenobiotica]